MTKTREELAASIDVAQWDWLRAHLERGGLIHVSTRLDLVDVAVKVAADDTSAVQQWITTGELRKPSALEIGGWNTNPELLFSMIIVSPFILFQEKKPILQ